jgi:hypothetical protein
MHDGTLDTYGDTTKKDWMRREAVQMAKIAKKWTKQ